jgi:hypothetical protein
MTLDRQSGRRRLAARIFTGLNVALFLVLIACAIVAVVMWERWH